MSTLPALRQQHPERIPLHLHDGLVFVWHPTDVARLRRDHAICGLMTGTLPLIPQQNVFLGLPMQLCDEEVAWLLREGVGMLIVDAPSHRRATKEEIEEYWQEYRDDVKLQRKETKKDREETRRMFEAKLGRGDPSPSSSSTAAVPDVKAEEEDDNAELEKIPYHHLTIGDSSDLPWYTPSLTEPGATAYLTLSTARKAGAFTFPRTETEMANLCVFETLHAKGYYMGVGLRFGGQFTAYPGDPLRYHAHYSAAVFARPTSSTSALEIVASGRLGTAVKKSHLICCVDSPLSPSPSSAAKEGSVETEERIRTEVESGRYDDVSNEWGKVDFFSLSWAGFGT